MTRQHVVVPLLVFAYVSGMVFALAKAHPFTPAAPAATGATVKLGDAYRGELVFQDTCATCHGLAGAGGGIGPALAGRGLDLAAVQAQIETGSGAMPGGLVEGNELRDVLAYVAQITRQ